MLTAPTAECRVAPRCAEHAWHRLRRPRAKWGFRVGSAKRHETGRRRLEVIRRSLPLPPAPATPRTRTQLRAQGQEADTQRQRDTVGRTQETSAGRTHTRQVWRCAEARSNADTSLTCRPTVAAAGKHRKLSVVIRNESSHVAVIVLRHEDHEHGIWRTVRDRAEMGSRGSAFK